MSDATPSVICFGEILWDFLPRGLFPGGAPHNVAYHLHQLGLNSHLVSAVGRDVLGDELLRRLRHWDCPLDSMSRHLGLPTGYVTATLGPAGEVQYEITASVAWDQISVGEDTIRVAVEAGAAVFGSLAQRSSFNRAALDRLLTVLPAEALRVFDVNLRPPHDDLDLVRELAGRATLLKLNTAEAARLTDDNAASGREESHARTLAAQTGCPTVCITAGERGAGILSEGTWHWVESQPTTVRDSVGAGDAFLAGLIAGLLRHGETPATALGRACRMGEFIAAHDGATPAYQCDARGHPVDQTP